jgi:hypothetical protein
MQLSVQWLNKRLEQNMLFQKYGQISQEWRLKMKPEFKLLTGCLFRRGAEAPRSLEERLPAAI